MEAHVWPEECGLAYHFFQWVRFCDESMNLAEVNVFDPTASFEFPNQDFNQVGTMPKRIKVNFLSLLGAMSPLPQHFNMPMLSSSPESNAFYAFIAMINRIFYRALYASWKANHLHFFRKSRGMYHEMLSPYASTPWLARPYLQYTPTMIGLRALLYRLCQDVVIQVSHENGFQVLSSGFGKLSDVSKKRLSDNALLGNRVLSHDGRLVLSVGPLPCEQARDWLPAGEMGTKVLKHVKHYLGAAYQVSWKLMIVSQQSQACLGQQDALSGYAFLGKSMQFKAISSRA